MSTEMKHWSSELLTILGMWLWERGEYGHALLCIHGPMWGYKIGHQLKITWYDVLHTEDHEVQLELMYPDKYVDHRPIIGIARDYIEKAHDKVKFENWEDCLYMNYKTNKPLTSSTLNRELQRFSKQFIAEFRQKQGVGLKLKPLKSNAFQIAWAIKTLERYYYSKKSFIAVSKFMGHRSLKDTIELLEVEPYDNIYFDFSGSSYNEQFDSSILENDRQLKYYAGYAFDLGI